MDGQDVVDFLHSKHSLLEKPENAARALVTESFKRGSHDNVTVVVVVFRETIGGRGSEDGVPHLTSHAETEEVE
jgi:serine/threonine protein phosphatase PrpC